VAKLPGGGHRNLRWRIASRLLLSNNLWLMSRNPAWTDDELILALDLYFRLNPARTSDSNPAIIELSGVLNSLPIHAEALRGEKFRNPSGVYMKLCNFLRFDPGYSGKGLVAGAAGAKKSFGIHTAQTGSSLPA
jgi:hypothetical protein